MIDLIHRIVSKIWHLPLVQFFIPAKFYCSIEYWRRLDRKLNLKNPRTFNEKIQWLKLYDHNPIYPKLVDKYEVRQYVKDMIGEKYLVPLIGIYNTVEEIPFQELPKEYVLKCTHDSGTAIIKNELCQLTVEDIKQLLKKGLKRKYYYEHREWPYKFIKPRIICEKYLVDESGYELKDYKIHCFNGEPKLIQVDFGRFSIHRRNLYDMQWNFIDASIMYPNDPSTEIKRPHKLQEMLEIASVLSYSFPYVRVDLYVVNDRIYFGELTFHHGAGYEKITPESYNLLMGSWLKLPLINSCKGNAEN